MATKLTPKGKAAVLAGGASAALAIASVFVPDWEGTRLTPYLDSVGVETVCSGETRVIMRKYSADECAEITAKMLVEFQEAVKKASPGIEKYPWQWAAHTSFAVNIGKAGYSKSSVSRLFKAGDYIGACRFMREYKYAGGKVLKGLVYRREGNLTRIGEYELCLADAVPAAMGAI